MGRLGRGTRHPLRGQAAPRRPSRRPPGAAGGAPRGPPRDEPRPPPPGARLRRPRRPARGGARDAAGGDPVRPRRGRAARPGGRGGARLPDRVRPRIPAPPRLAAPRPQARQRRGRPRQGGADRPQPRRSSWGRSPGSRHPRLARARAGDRPRAVRRHRRVGARDDADRRADPHGALRRRGDVGEPPPLAPGAPPDAADARTGSTPCPRRCARSSRHASASIPRPGRRSRTCTTRSHRSGLPAPPVHHVRTPLAPGSAIPSSRCPRPGARR